MLKNYCGNKQQFLSSNFVWFEKNNTSNSNLPKHRHRNLPFIFQELEPILTRPRGMFYMAEQRMHRVCQALPMFDNRFAPGVFKE